MSTQLGCEDPPHGVMGARRSGGIRSVEGLGELTPYRLPAASVAWPGNDLSLVGACLRRDSKRECISKLT